MDSWTRGNGHATHPPLVLRSLKQCPSVGTRERIAGSSMTNATCQPSKRRTLEAMVIAIDDAVGGVVDALRQGALWHRTLLLFLSDNGGAVSKQGSNLPLRGGKKGLFQGGVRVYTYAYAYAYTHTYTYTYTKGLFEGGVRVSIRSEPELGARLGARLALFDVRECLSAPFA